MGEKAVPEEKLTIKKKDLPSAEDTKVIVLKTPWVFGINLKI